MNALAKVELPVDRGARAKAWREAKELSRPQLGELIGYSYSQIQEFENGIGKKGSQISERAWRSYTIKCASLELKADAKRYAAIMAEATALEDKIIASFDWGKR